jgi:hypothetical protein
MNRLNHSDAGFIRSLQISTRNFFAFVEGRLDRTYYDRLLQKTFAGTMVKHNVYAAIELPSSTGGKMRVLAFFKELRKRKLLITESFGKKFVSVFFLDKDIDDLNNAKLRSASLIYTSTYDLEGNLFSCADLARAVADACGMTLEQAEVEIGEQKQWLDQCVERWSHWVVLCIISHIHRVNCGQSYDRTSTINPNLIDATDMSAFVIEKTALSQRLALTSKEFDTVFAKYEAKLIESLRTGKSLQYFRGKWLAPVIEKQLQQKCSVPGMNKNGIGEKIVTTLVAQVGNEAHCRCCSQHESQLKRLAEHLS